MERGVRPERLGFALPRSSSQERLKRWGGRLIKCHRTASGQGRKRQGNGKERVKGVDTKEKEGDVRSFGHKPERIRNEVLIYTRGNRGVRWTLKFTKKK